MWVSRIFHFWNWGFPFRNIQAQTHTFGKWHYTWWKCSCHVACACRLLSTSAEVCMHTPRGSSTSTQNPTLSHNIQVLKVWVSKLWVSKVWVSSTNFSISSGEVGARKCGFRPISRSATFESGTFGPVYYGSKVFNVVELVETMLRATTWYLFQRLQWC